MTDDEKRLFAGMRAFDAMYTRVESRLRDAAIRMLRDATEAAEFMRDCKACVLVASLTFDPSKARFAKWAEWIVVDTCKKRREQLDKEISLEDMDCLPDKRDQIAQAEDRIDCEMAVARLPKMQKECWKRRQQGFTYSEIGHALGIDANAAKANVHLAKAKLIIDVGG